MSPSLLDLTTVHHNAVLCAEKVTSIALSATEDDHNKRRKVVFSIINLAYSVFIPVPSLPSMWVVSVCQLQYTDFVNL